ncbi:hypothetical protein DLAC_01202 [Tieghemostelium lacteum]|uniref:Transmembrane protein n=1 Tax=Tieghemostelium lacteum TaxID=361077 RepID=A0A152A836_TIELA|nr:hypothetical protein DLAC_01202 [Tieghemostelium lacteum]|eukprot:KYR02368.1 hypothetical protein DLAC_01202 [Tieghemostelium lacteum]
MKQLNILLLILLSTIFISNVVNADCCLGASVSVVDMSLNDCDPLYKDNFFITYTCNGYSTSAESIFNAQVCDSCSTNVTSGGIAVFVVVPIVLLMMCCCCIYACCCRPGKRYHHHNIFYSQPQYVPVPPDNHHHHHHSSNVPVYQTQPQVFQPQVYQPQSYNM